jgi:hypothetical protein
MTTVRPAPRSRGVGRIHFEAKESIAEVMIRLHRTVTDISPPCAQLAVKLSRLALEERELVAGERGVGELLEVLAPEHVIE